MRSRACASERITLSEAPDFFGPQILGRIVGCHEGEAYKMTKRPGFPARIVGKKIVIRKDAFIRWWDQQAQ